MTERRLIIEMGMGNSQYDGDCTKAAIRAVENAMRRSSLPVFGSIGLDHTEMRVQVTVGVQDPDAVDTDAVAATLPRGRAEVRAVKGGLDVPTEPDAPPIVIATAAVEAFLPDQAGRWRKTS